MLQSPPSEKHLSRIYHELRLLGAQSGGEKAPWPYGRNNPPEKTLALASEMSRHDPRLFGIVVGFLFKRWRILVPQKIREHYPRMECPQALAVAAEFVKSAGPDAETLYFMDYLQKGLKPVPSQFFFRSLYAPGGRLSRRAAETGLKQYKKWGFLAREAPTIDVFQKKSLGYPDLDSRLNILRELFAARRRIRLSDYLKALGDGITRQQALQDMKRVARLYQKMRGRGALWVRKAGR